jgi:D-alanyl-D-alanine carboxypeptidase
MDGDSEDHQRRYQQKLDIFTESLQRSYDVLVSKKYDDKYNKYADYAKNPAAILEAKKKKKVTCQKKKKKNQTDKIKPTEDQIQQILRKDKCVEIFKDVHSEATVFQN